MTVRLRAHHLLCLLTYVGKGYSPAFTANYDVVVQRLAGGEHVLIVSGPDDICAPLLDGPDQHCLSESAAGRDDIAALDVAGLLDRPLRPGTRLELDASTLGRMREAFSFGRTRKACPGCEWFELCGKVAAGGFHGTRL
jgi:hypothetical protein